LEPTLPLRKKNDLDNAIELFIKNVDKADSLVSVGEVRLENPHIMKKIEKEFERRDVHSGMMEDFSICNRCVG